MVLLPCKEYIAAEDPDTGGDNADGGGAGLERGALLDVRLEEPEVTVFVADKAQGGDVAQPGSLDRGGGYASQTRI